jgi:hypothetical protein
MNGVAGQQRERGSLCETLSAFVLGKVANVLANEPPLMAVHFKVS